LPAYYNEIDTYAADWLRNLISHNLIADGVVDTRSITEVSISDLKDFTQCHFFAGIGGWSYALRLAGWSDDTPVWTGSCPCQPFSLAGLQRGFDDERHLWPTWFNLIKECRPPTVFGEQVASATRWLELIRSNLEELDYTFGAIPLEAASAGAPHRRDRLWFTAYAEWNKQPREEPRSGEAGRVGREQQSLPWNEPWTSALSRLRALDDGLPRSVAGTDAARNAIVPQVAAEFIKATL
jgi:DNA (cytosine-5)-methyltransferase 1